MSHGNMALLMRPASITLHGLMCMSALCRYVDKHPHYDPVHRSSEAFKAFQAQCLDQVEVEKEGQSYFEQDLGFM